MARLPDEQWAMIEDSINKKNIARSSHNKRTHCGSSGGVRLPSDYMTRKELKSMNGEVKTYKMHDPMTWKEFRDLPDDLKKEYIKYIRERFGAPNTAIAEAFGVSNTLFGNWIRCLGLASGKCHCGTSSKWAKTDESTLFKKWWNREEESDATEPENVEMTEPDNVGTTEPENVGTTDTEDCKVVEDAVVSKLGNDRAKVCYGEESKSSESCGYFAVPRQGSLSFTCEAYKALDMVKQILGSTNVSIDISWTVN